MPLQVQILPVDKGVVRSKNEALLAEGELTYARDAEYRPRSPGIHKVPGRTAFNATPEAAPIRALASLRFDGAPDLLVAATSTLWKYAPVAKTGTLVTLISGKSATSPNLDAVHWDNEWFIHNGVDRASVVSSDASVALLGMLANTEVPRITAENTSSYELSSGSTMDYWVEERVKDADGNIIRRNAATAETVARVVGTGGGIPVKVRVYRPGPRNSDATHWALYSGQTNISFPIGAEIAEAPINTEFIDDTRTGTDPAIPSGLAYQIITVTLLAGGAVSVPKNGEPPISSIAEIYEDCHVVNDVENPTHLRYSDVADMHAFPATNVIKFNTRKGDGLRMIRRLGQLCIVSLDDSLWRVLTLPNAADSAFLPERVKEEIDGAFGCTGPKAADTFSFGRGMLLAYVSYNGVHVTDGYTWDDITNDIDWEDTVEISQLDKAILTVDPATYQIKFEYTPKGSAQINSAAMYLHFHPSHVKVSENGGFRAKLTDPITLHANDFAVAIVDGERRMFSANNDGHIYLEREGHTDAAGNGIHFSVRTRRTYPIGIGTEMRVMATLASIKPPASGPIPTFRLLTNSRAIGRGDVVELRTILGQHPGVHADKTNHTGEGFLFGVDQDDAQGPFSVDFFGYLFQSQGASERSNK